MAFYSSAPSCCSLIHAYSRTALSKSSPRRCLLLPIRCTTRTPPQRSADYQPSSWSDEYIQSLTTDTKLGVAYHFKEDIKDALWTIYVSMEEVSMLLKDNLHATALMFRLLREHGFAVSEGD
ncbi:hypothetical protein C4D60_Mb04t07380 [Musa balbisiana]|uniref:Terpene synthase N-terminal domain-containing protein n=1 Tax=Musa balbisiana TaxID=52838 RepID=A0A4S8KAA2_MUSBA|nr:hypothetical protein C4D60_Mb04t07380 [Musa balbisiana]